MQLGPHNTIRSRCNSHTVKPTIALGKEEAILFKIKGITKRIIRSTKTGVKAR